MAAIGFLVAAMLAAGVVSCTSPATPQAGDLVPLPKLGSAPLPMRVVYLVNDRLPRMDAQQLRTLLDATAATAKAHFQVELVFGAVDEMPIAQAFARIPPERRKAVLAQVYDFRSGRADPLRLEKAFASEFAKVREPLDKQVEFARPHAPDLSRQPDYEEFGRVMAKLQLRQLARWQAMKAPDGRGVLDDADFNEYMLWLVLGYGDMPYELVLTNQIIASVEHVLPAVHSAVRGGYTNGITTPSLRSRYGTLSVWSTFAFTGNEAALVAWRNGERYEPLEAARLAGITATHEIGHQLFHLLHPFGRSACVMNPVPMFAYREWALQLAPERCRLGSDKAMTPGSDVFRF